MYNAKEMYFKMLKEKSIELIRNLDPLIGKYSSNNKVRKIIVDEFDKRNMKGSLGIFILNRRRELSTLNINDGKDLILLFVFTVGLFNALSYKEDPSSATLGEISEILKISPENYFTPVEIENFTDYKLEKKSSKKEEVVFPNMIQIAPKFWVGGLSAKLFAELDAGNEFIYNFKTQRDPVIDIYGEKRIKLIKTKVQEIKNSLLSGNQFPDAIVINVLSDGNDEIIHEKNGDLRILSGEKNIVDGQHRKVANSLAIEENPELDFNWIFIVTNFSEIKAQRQMVQINKQEKMRPEHIKNMDASSLGNVVVDAIKDSDSEFGQNIRNNDKELEFGGLTKKSTLTTAIEEVYNGKLIDRIQAKQIAKHIANVMDHIMGLYIEEFITNPKDTRKVSYINHKNMFAGYVALSEKLYEEKNWEDKLEEVLDKIDFSVNNTIWEEIGLNKGDMNKSTRNNLYNLFQN